MGRVETGDFVAVPEIAVVALQILGEGLTVDDTRQRLLLGQGRDIDVQDLVQSFVDLGFVASIDDQQLPDVSVPRPSLPWISERAVRWTIRRPTVAAVLALVAAGAVALPVAPEIVPNHTDLLWTTSTTAVVLGNVIIAWSIIFLHELAHLMTARAHGVAGRISLGTRLQFLVAQTDVSGIWASPRKARLTVYLSGIAVNLSVASGGLLVRVIFGPTSTVGTIAAAIVLLALLPLPIQFLVFMRTDIYYVIQDVASCRNLYADGSAYVLWLLRRCSRILGVDSGLQSDPSARLPHRERRAVKTYAVLLAAGTLACLLVAVIVTVPFVLALIARMTDSLVAAGGVGAWVDALATLLVAIGFWILWAQAWWRRHGWQVRGWFRGGAQGGEASV